MDNHSSVDSFPIPIPDVNCFRASQKHQSFRHSQNTDNSVPWLHGCAPELLWA